MHKLLIVDDEKDVLFFLKTFFQTRKFDVYTAETGEEAVQKVKEARPHIVLMDIRMPGIGGVEALKRIKAIDPAVAVIMATAVYDEPTAKEALTLGAYDYVTKPFNLEYMETTVSIKLAQMLG